MISFAPLWQTMKKKEITTYDLKHRLKIGGGTYNRLKNNQHVSSHTLEILCQYLNCSIQEIVCFEFEKQTQKGKSLPQDS